MGVMGFRDAWDWNHMTQLHKWKKFIQVVCEKPLWYSITAAGIFLTKNSWNRIENKKLWKSLQLCIITSSTLLSFGTWGLSQLSQLTDLPVDYWPLQSWNWVKCRREACLRSVDQTRLSAQSGVAWAESDCPLADHPEFTNLPVGRRTEHLLSSAACSPCFGVCFLSAVLKKMIIMSFGISMQKLYTLDTCLSDFRWAFFCPCHTLMSFQ